ncbi:hypothetical protein [Nannocystis pusilla]|uniref:hypothetical protein n=1 Tax=Nannocystis pusilla TaxID=889268 RepID=UPI003B76DAC7
MTTIRDPFRPFVAVDDGARLVLTRRRSAADWLLRGALYWLLALVVVLMGLIPYAAWTRGSSVGDVVLAVVLLTLTWFVLQLVMLGFHVDGVRRIAVGPGEVVLDARASGRVGSVTAARRAAVSRGCGRGGGRTCRAGGACRRDRSRRPGWRG